MSRWRFGRKCWLRRDYGFSLQWKRPCLTGPFFICSHCSMPMQAKRHAARREYKMQHAPAARSCCLGRGVQRERFDQQGAALRHGTDNFAHFRAQRQRLLIVQASQSMRARHYAKGAVVDAACVDMQPYRDEILQERLWRLYKRHALLFRPAHEIGVSDLFSNRNTYILVDRHQPVLVLRLFKIGALDGDRIGRQQASNGRMLANRLRERLAPLLVEPTSGTHAAGVELIERPGNSLALRAGQNVG